MTDRPHHRAASATIPPVLLALLLAGCTMGPDFTRPAPVLPPQWQEAQGAAQPIPAQWWTSFNDPMLDGLIKRGAGANLDLQMALERITAARIQRGAARAGALPTLDAQGGYSRDHVSTIGVNDLLAPWLGVEHLPPQAPKSLDFDQFSLGAGASWEIDLWGRQRRLREAAQAGVDAAEADAAGTRLSVQAEIARTYFQWRALTIRRALTAEAIALVEQNAAIAQRLQARGLAARADVIDSDAQRRAMRIEQDAVAAEQQRTARALAVLVGGAPDAPLPPLAENLAPPAFGAIPARLPSEMLRRRPDIAAAEARLHAATAQIGVAKADFYPSINLTGQLSLDALKLADLGWDARNSSAGALVSLPIFNGGRLERQLELRQSEQRSAALAYRATVIAAWREVEDGLTQLRMMTVRLTLLRDDAAALADKVRMLEARQRRGDIAMGPVLAARQAALQARAAQVRAEYEAAVAFTDLVAALGG